MPCRTVPKVSCEGRQSPLQSQIAGDWPWPRWTPQSSPLFPIPRLGSSYPWLSLLPLLPGTRLRIARRPLKLLAHSWAVFLFFFIFATPVQQPSHRHTPISKALPGPFPVTSFSSPSPFHPAVLTSSRQTVGPLFRRLSLWNGKGSLNAPGIYIRISVFFGNSEHLRLSLII